MTKQFIPTTTQNDIVEWQNQMRIVRRLYYKGKYPNGKEIIKMMEDIFKNMKEEFATGEGIYVS